MHVARPDFLQGVGSAEARRCPGPTCTRPMLDVAQQRGISGQQLQVGARLRFVHELWPDPMSLWPLTVLPSLDSGATEAPGTSAQVQSRTRGSAPRRSCPTHLAAVKRPHYLRTSCPNRADVRPCRLANHHQLFVCLETGLQLSSSLPLLPQLFTPEAAALLHLLFFFLCDPPHRSSSTSLPDFTSIHPSAIIGILRTLVGK